MEISVAVSISGEGLEVGEFLLICLRVVGRLEEYAHVENS